MSKPPSPKLSPFFPGQKENSEPISTQKTISVHAKKSSLQQELALLKSPKREEGQERNPTTVLVES
jgi:hypothetical protein